MKNNALSQEQVDQYRRDGYLKSIRVLTDDQAEKAHAALEQGEAKLESLGLPNPPGVYLRSNAHLIFTLVSDLARNPEILDVVSSLLGPDLLVWSAEFFIKEANTDKIVSWHQDLTYWGLGPTDDEVTAWLALTPATKESGCMRFVPGSHKNTLLDHNDTFAEDNLLSRGQELSVEVDETQTVDIELQPGEISLHHGRIFHASGPNVTNERRIGLAIRYIRPEVQQQVAAKDYAMVVRGWDRFGHFVPVAPPIRDFEAVDLKRREQVMEDQAKALAEGSDQPLWRG